MPSESFEEVMNIFKTTICPIELPSDDKEYDLTMFYKINHACIWNKIDNIDKLCEIIAKNDKIAHVQIIGENVRFDASCFYRLEDLTLIEHSIIKS